MYEGFYHIRKWIVSLTISVIMKRIESKCVLHVVEKLNLEKNNSPLRISVRFEEFIRKFVNEEFDAADPKYPLGFCGSCRLALCDREKGILFTRMWGPCNWFRLLLLLKP